MTHAVVVGGGVGGLAAAIALAQRGVRVTVCEAKSSFGGLASALEVDGTRFDGGPYILLDPEGLTWALDALGLSLDGLKRVTDVYEVERDPSRDRPVRFFADLAETIERLERDHPGQGVRYGRFVAEVTKIHRGLAALQRRARPSPLALVRSGGLRNAPFLLRSLATTLHRAGLEGLVADAVGIWTHIAGQTLSTAPSPLALVPAMIHGAGCFVPARGMAAIPELVEGRARALGATLRADARVRRVTTANGRVSGVELADGETLHADFVVSDASGVATLLELAPTPARARAKVASLPLQSPGVAAYGRGALHDDGPYLRFRLAPDDPSAPCRLIVRPHRIDPHATAPSPHPIRIVAPLDHALAEQLGEQGQTELLDRVLADPWIAQRVGPFEELARLVPASWGRRHVLHRDSMNPVMTARFMRQGRLPHRVDAPEGLFLVGSSTHPGQWVSFCLISGVLGADEVFRWLDERAGSCSPR